MEQERPEAPLPVHAGGRAGKSAQEQGVAGGGGQRCGERLVTTNRGESWWAGDRSAFLRGSRGGMKGGYEGRAGHTASQAPWHHFSTEARSHGKILRRTVLTGSDLYFGRLPLADTGGWTSPGRNWQRGDPWGSY